MRNSSINDVTISSQSGHRMKQLTPKKDEQLAITLSEELLNLEILRPENIADTFHILTQTR